MYFVCEKKTIIAIKDRPYFSSLVTETILYFYFMCTRTIRIIRKINSKHILSI